MINGIYFNKTTNEVMTITDTDDHPGKEWLRVVEETGLGLIAIRNLLADRELADDPAAVYWHMPQPEESTDSFFCADGPVVEHAHVGLLSRLIDTVRGGRRPPRPSPQGGVGG